jgi:hypothetical protein
LAINSQSFGVKLLARDQEMYALGAEPRTHQHAIGASQADRGDGESLTRGTAHEDRRRTLQSHSGMASIDVEVAEKDAGFTFALNRDKLRKTRRREGRYLLRTSLCDEEMRGGGWDAGRA